MPRADEHPQLPFGEAAVGHDWVAVDVETAMPARDSLCSIAAVQVQAGRVVRTFERLVRPPGNVYGPYNTAVHGLTAADTARSPTFGEVWDDFWSFVGGRPLVAHNAAFDRNVVQRSLEACGRDYPTRSEWHCTVAYGRLAWPQLSDHKLPTLCRSLGIPLTRHHQATADALACAAVGIAVLEATGVGSFAEAERRLGRGR
jgi:DNA polymerase-3 subunit epsilon